MNIHFYINGSFPFGMAASKRRLCYAKGLIAQGHVVDVVVCQKCFEKSYDDGMPVKGEYKGINYIYVCGKFKHSKSNKLMRGLDYYLLDYLRSFLYALRNIHHGDVVFAYYYPILLQILIIIATKLKGAKIVKETCEHPSVFGDNKSYWYKFCRWFEFNFVMMQYDGFIAISRDLKKFVDKYKSKKAECIIVPILVDDPFEDINKSEIKRYYNEPYIIHTGTMYEQKDSISKILHAFAQFKRETDYACKLVFTGPQANNKCEYLPLIRSLGIEKDVVLLGMVDSKKVVELQYYATMTIIYKSDNLQTRNCFPTKLGEMLICGVPVITTTVGDANMYLENGKSAFIINPDDDIKLIEYMKLIMDNHVLAKQVGNAGKQVALKHFNPYYQGRRLSHFFNSL